MNTECALELGPCVWRLSLALMQVSRIRKQSIMNLDLLVFGAQSHAMGVSLKHC